jgi:ABC-type polysaccharide/polyol phosphate export permease
MTTSAEAVSATAATAVAAASASVPQLRRSAKHFSWLREIARRRDLLYMLTLREIKLKYKQSVMGLLWAVLMPAIIVTAGVVVKYAFATLSGTTLRKEDIVGVAVRSVPWAFVVASIRFATNSLIVNANLVAKIYMPRVIFPIATVISQLLDLAVATCVLAVVLVVAGIAPNAHMLWLPGFVCILVLFVTGTSIFLSAAALFFRDVKYIVEVFITFAIFFTPVFYEVSMFGRRGELLLLNPVAPLLEGISAAVLARPGPGGGWILYSAVVSIAVFVGALAFFKRVEPYFAESV